MHIKVVKTFLKNKHKIEDSVGFYEQQRRKMVLEEIHRRLQLYLKCFFSP